MYENMKIPFFNLKSKVGQRRVNLKD